MKPPLLFRLLGRAGQSLPEPVLRAVLRPVAGRLARVAGRQRRVLTRVLGHRGAAVDARELQALLAATATLYGETLVNLCLLCRPGSFMTPPRPIDLPLLPIIARLRERRKGVVLAIAHFGDLFMAVSALARQGLPVTAIFVDGGRYRWVEVEKLRFVSLGAAAVPATRALAANELVMTYDDLPLFPEARTSNLFGAPVFPPNGAARLALAAGAPVLPIYSILENGRHRVEADAPILPEEASTQEAVEERLLRSLEKYIDRYPSHWMPFHDVWDLDVMRGRHRRLGNLV